MFNVRTKHYPDGSMQVKTYSYVNITHEKTDEKKNNRIDTPFGVAKYESFEQAELAQEISKRNSYKRTISSIYDIARSNRWDLFVTMTFDPDKVNRYDYSEVTKKFSRWLDSVRRTNKDMIYLFVPEQHKDGAWHFHGLMSNCIDNLKLTDSGKRHNGEIIYNMGKYKYGWNTATYVKSSDACCKYILKYVTKDVMEKTKNKKKYWASRNVNIPVIEDELIINEELEIVKENLLENATFTKTIDSIVCGEVRRMNVFEIPAEW